MPYSREFANKAGHTDIVKNPDVKAFLDDCQFITEPSEEEGQRIGSRFEPAPSIEVETLPENILAFDGSRYEASINDRLPHTRVGYVRVGTVLIRTSEYNNLRTGRFVDPFRVAKLQDNNDALPYTVPSANMNYKGTSNVRDGFRAAVDSQFFDSRTRFVPGDPSTSLRSTLFHIFSHKPDFDTPRPVDIELFRCPSCSEKSVSVQDIAESQVCPSCQEPVYATDVLRLWEEVTEYQSNLTAITRLMLAIEHLTAAHYLRYISKDVPEMLKDIAIFMDGPLMVTGPAAWMHRSLMRYYYLLNQDLRRRGHEPFLLLGLQKTGQIVDYAAMIDRYIPRNSLFCIDDEHRYKYIVASRQPAASGFGFDTHYGQDFIYKTATGRTFVFSLPYPFETKEAQGAIPFVQAKTELSNYPQLGRALKVITEFETDLFENAVVPIALANRYTAISLSPGGRVLDLLTRQSLKT